MEKLHAVNGKKIVSCVIGLFFPCMVFKIQTVVILWVALPNFSPPNDLWDCRQLYFDGGHC